MRRRLYSVYLLVFLFVLCSCNNANNTNNIQNNEERSNRICFESLDSISIFEFDATKISEKDYLSHWIKTNYCAFNYEIKLDKSIENENLIIYKLNVVGEIPNNFKRDFTFVYFKLTQSAILIPIEYLTLYNINNEIFIGGLYTNREYGYFFLYKINNIFSIKCIDSRDTDLPVSYYKNNECFEYVPQTLNFFQYIDSFVFIGYKKIYCQEGYDRDTSLVSHYRLKKIYYRGYYINGHWEVKY